ncbi:MAG: metal-dependent transcriptional regulator [Candidatus Bathycorpusculaceae bacterium]
MSMAEEVTAVIEEYLETVYRLQEKSGVARTSDIVKLLRVVPGTVTNTVERLEKEGLVKHEPYKGVKLTEKGLRLALQVVRRHRLSERLLTDILHVEWTKVHEAACKLEHGITDEIIKPLEKALRHPKTCPHGNPIPTKCGGIIEEKSEPLTALNEREQGSIVKITEERSDLLSYLYNMGLLPGTSVEIVEKAPFEGPITLKVGGITRALSRTVASVIQVKRTM